jgi:hypothetical protein
MKLALIPTLLLFPLTLTAAPALQMHVFDENTATVQVQPGNTQPALQIHVFPNIAGVQPDHAPLKQHRQLPPAKKSPFLAYDRAEMYVQTGYREDKLRWNTGFPNGSDPNILSELTWTDLKIATLGIGVKLYTRSNWEFELDLNYGKIFSGDNQDSDYLGNNRTLEFSRSNNNADKGVVIDASVNAGYPLVLLNMIVMS